MSRPRRAGAAYSTASEPAPKKAKKEPKQPKKKASEEKAAAAPEKKTTPEPETEETDWENASTVYEFSANDIHGKEVSLDKYKGKVCIIVNVASKCGHTKSNYEQFVELFDKYSKEKGLCILAFPCNQFGSQEPGSNKKILEFCEKRDVKFDLFEKINVNGPNAHPLFKYLNKILPDPKIKEKIKWNFTKFIIDSKGKPVERFASAVKPLTLVETLEKYW